MITRVVGENILSWEHLDFTIPSGITAITGFNHDDQCPEGSGKSAILNAITWCFYGRLPKEAKLDDVVMHGKKSASVRVYLTNGTEVVRTRKPHSLHIMKDGHKVLGKDARETQLFIEQEIGLSFETFCQTVYFAQNDPKKFITANEAERAKVFSEIIDLSQFDRARELAHEELKQVDMTLAKLDAEFEYLPKMISQVESSIGSFREMLKEAEEKHYSRVQELEADLKEVVEELKEHQEVKAKTRPKAKAAKAELKTLEEEQEALKERISVLREKIAVADKSAKTIDFLQSKIEKSKAVITEIQEEIEELGARAPGECPTCGAQMTKEKHEAALAKEHKELTQDLQEEKDTLKDYKAQLKSLTSEDISDLEVEMKKLKEKVSSLDEDSVKFEKILDAEEELLENLSKLEEEEAEIKERLESLKKEAPGASIKAKLKQNKEALNKLREDKAGMESKQTGLREEQAQLQTLKAGFKEIKSYVIRGVLEELSARSNEYLAQLFEVPIHILFHNEGEDGEVSKIRIDVEMNGVLQGLGLYSGGQFRRISLAVDLALSDIIASRGHKPFNLLILDEYFKDLSEPSMEKILHLLESLRKPTLMIEHNSLFKNIVQHTYRVELQDGVSRFVDQVQ